MIVGYAKRHSYFGQEFVGGLVTGVGSDGFRVSQVDITLGHFFGVVEGVGVKKIYSQTRDIFQRKGI